jgi:hypothetical protein
MSAPRLTEQHHRLERLAGDWEARETVFPSSWSPKELEADCSMTARLGIDGFFLIFDYDHREPERRIAFRAHGVIGWDTQQAAYVMHWFDAYGAWMAGGDWSDNKLRFDFPNHRVSYEFKGEAYLFRIEIKQDGEFQLSQEGTYRRKERGVSAA